MAWVYCECGQGLGYPSTRDVLLDCYVCPSCGLKNDPHVTKEEVMSDMLERIENLESELQHLKEGTQP